MKPSGSEIFALFRILADRLLPEIGTKIPRASVSGPQPHQQDGSLFHQHGAG